MNRFHLFEQRYQTALNRIQKYLEPDERYNPPMDGLVRWMLTTDANPYSYLPKKQACMLNSATGFESLLDQIHHALYDDGDITFVRVRGVPQIAFVDRHDINDERTEILDILPNEFGPIQDQFRREDTHR